MEAFDRECTSLRSKFSSVATPTVAFEESKHRDIQKKLESIVNEKEPLIISILSTVYEDLKELHKNLGVFCAVDPRPSDIQAA